MDKYDEKKQLKCSFCGKPQGQVRRLIAGPNVYICDECVQLCREIIEDGIEAEENEKYEAGDGKLPKPKEISETLSDYVIDQDEAKKALAVAVYNHYKRINYLDKDNNDIEIQKSNIIMIGHYRLRKDPAGSDTGKNTQCAVCNSRCHSSYRGRICR